MDETISRITSHGNPPEEVEMDAVTQVPVPRNEPVHSYAPGSPGAGDPRMAGGCRSRPGRRSC